MTNFKQFKEVIKAFSYIRKWDNNFYMMSVNWAQILRYHPYLFLGYLVLHKKKISFFLEAYYKFFKYICLILKQLLLSFFVLKKKCNKKLLESEILIISHFLNKNNLGSKEDFHFRDLPNILAKDNYSVNIFLHNHTSFPPDSIEQSWNNSQIPRYVCSNRLNFTEELKIVLRGINILYYFLFVFKNKDRFINRVRIMSAIEAISPASLGAERFSRQLEKFVNRTNPKFIIFTFEGHSWERLVINKIKNLKKKIMCIGFVHTITFPNQHAALTKYPQQFMPDHILVPGKEAKETFQKKLLNSVPIQVVGSPKKLKITLNFKKKDNLRVLILPEGFITETNLLINFGLALATKCPEIKFRIRIHPEILNRENRYVKIIKKKKLSNIKISKNTLNNDALWGSHAIYRGSTSILEAMTLAVIPIYYSRKNELSIDPLFLMKNQKHCVKTIEDTIVKFNLWKKMTSEQKLSYKIQYVNFCNSLVQPLNTKILKKVIKSNNKLRSVI